MMVYMLLLCDNPVFMIRSCLYLFQMMVFCCLGYHIKHKTKLIILNEKREFGYSDSHYSKTHQNVRNVMSIIVTLTVCNTIGVINKAVNYGWAHSFGEIDIKTSAFYFVCDVFTGVREVDIFIYGIMEVVTYFIWQLPIITIFWQKKDQIVRSTSSTAIHP